MFTRRIHLETALFAMAALFLSVTSGQSAQTGNLQTPATPDPSLTTPSSNGDDDGPRVLRSHRSCQSEHKNYCSNGGNCMYPQDSDKPFCICTSSYTGPRCLFYNQSAESHSPPELEELIAIGFGVAIVVLVLAIVIFCLVYRRCIISGHLMKPAALETSA